MTRRSLVLALFGSILVLAMSYHSSPSIAQITEPTQQPPVVIVVDTSGSMGDKDTNGKLKIEGAGEALVSMLHGVPGSARVGVWTYPAAGGCDSGHMSTTIQPVAGLDAGSVTESWVADGDTPTGAALRAAAEVLHDNGGRTMILISDGESTCNPDPCTVAQQLAAEGYQIQVDTIGFEISDVGRSELSCISDATGGSYVDAHDTDQLREILEDLANIDMSISTSVLGGQLPDQVGYKPVTLTAHIENRGTVAAHDVDITLRLTGDTSFGILDATRRLPIVGSGTGNEVTWQLNLPLGCDASDVPYEVIVRSQGVVEVSQTGMMYAPALDDRTVACLLLGGSVAILGDSYSSGEGAPEYDAGTNEPYNRCRRGQTYGRAARQSDDLKVLACSGAIIHDLLLPHGEHRTGPSESDPLLGSQLSQLLELGEDVDVVVLTISGNDIGFTDIVRSCVIDGGTRCTEEPDEALVIGHAAVEAVPNTLGQALRMVESTVNSGRSDPVQFVLLPYVGLLPVDGFPEQADECPIGSNLFNLELDSIEAAELTTLQAELNSSLALVARMLREEGRPVFFAQSVGNAAADHSLCDQEPWGHSVYAGEYLQAKASGRPMEALHPNASGYSAIWKSLLQEAAGWQVAERDVEQESVVEGGSLCAEDGDYRTMGLTEFKDAEFRRGECVAIVGTDEDVIDVYGLDRAVTALRTWIAFYLRSEPRLLGVAHPKASGEFRTLVWIPEDLPPGDHTVSVVVARPTGEVDITHSPVRIVEDDPAPYRSVLWLAAAGLLAGVAILLLSPKAKRVKA